MLRLSRHGHSTERLAPALIEAVEVLLINETTRAFDQDGMHTKLGPSTNRFRQRCEPRLVDTKRVGVRGLPAIVEDGRPLVTSGRDLRLRD